ncbi:two-component sensor histidine kinase [Leucobacter sp. CSA2]|uniref:histidine kinase n=1 Tax=Leucobacter edaphi TaxID=2796472 RepID=A0A934UVZ6_9MICO|nr:histidine kinase [Leucobacter edaphi]MBK0421114.1 two-component sensor histidine kinase [Leucobacter edaphi]
MSEAEVRLPRPPGVIRRALAAHPRAVDIFIVIWYFIGTGLGVLIDVTVLVNDPASPFMNPAQMTWPLLLFAVIRTLAVAAALYFRRRFPLAGLIVAVLAVFGPQGAVDLANSVAVLFMIYAVPVYRSVRAGWLGYGIALVGAVLAVYVPVGPRGMTLVGPSVGVNDGTGTEGVTTSIGTGITGNDSILIIVMTAVWYLAILMLGINLGNRRRYLAAIIDRAHQLARERDQRAQLAVAEERSRIAREMHDIVAHSVSVMIALSEGAARASATAPDAAADAMRRSAETGRTALTEMRRLLGALHSSGEEQAELVPQPGVDQVDDLVEGFRRAGLEIECTVNGQGAGDRGQELAIYRIVQEGLTNVLRYAGTGARVEVTIRQEAMRTTVKVRDYGRPANADLPVQGLGSGRGLTGLAERARVFGGRIESGPVPAAEGGGWRLWAELPVAASRRAPVFLGGDPQAPENP